MSRDQQRIALTLFVGLAAAAAVIWGDGYKIFSVPVPWVGLVWLIAAITGMLGVNVYWGGPLDKRLDPPAEPMSEHQLEERARQVAADRKKMDRLLFLVRAAGVAIFLGVAVHMIWFE
ncbi:hypothetical protein ABI59_13375 [Acidobacteria bacterium Mor1]|nr:hypothetical protein ABI59_13375 [Acidobacteria bacterium Mor1]